jgi:hypothetical protein
MYRQQSLSSRFFNHNLLNWLYQIKGSLQLVVALACWAAVSGAFIEAVGWRFNPPGRDAPEELRTLRERHFEGKRRALYNQ